MWSRLQREYSSPLLTSPNLLTYRWRLFKAEAPHLLENRMATVLTLLSIRREEVTVSEEEAWDAYDSLAAVIQEQPWPSEAKQAADFVIFQSLSLFTAMIGSSHRFAQIPASKLMPLARASARSELFVGAIYVALTSSSTDYNPNVLRQLMYDADKQMRSYIHLLGETGLVLCHCQGRSIKSSQM